MFEFFMKNLIPNGAGAFTIHRFAVNTEEAKAQTRDALLAAGDWADATREEWDNFQSAVPALGSILNGDEWANIQALTEEEKKSVRALVAGEAGAIEEKPTPDAGASEAGTDEAAA